MIPTALKIQWHITDRCNWRCTHCYQEDHVGNELTLVQLSQIFEKYLTFIDSWGLRKRQILAITGGEPFVRDDLFDLLRIIRDKAPDLHLCIMTNGSLLTNDSIIRLKKLRIDDVQVSIEGLEKENDTIRGTGSFIVVMKAINALKVHKLRCRVSLTLTLENIKDIPELVQILIKAGATGINTRRLVPMGRGSSMRERMLAPYALRDYYVLTDSINKDLRSRGIKFDIYNGCESAIFNDDPQNTLPAKYDCGVYTSRVLIIMPNGDVLPCRRLPIVVGNVLKNSLTEIWYSSEILNHLRNLNNAHEFCKRCTNFRACFGGAVCITYAYHERLSVPDPQCWKFSDLLPDPGEYAECKECVPKSQLLLGSLQQDNKRV